MIFITILVLVVLVLAIVIVRKNNRISKIEAEIATSNNENESLEKQNQAFLQTINEYEEKYSTLIDKDKAIKEREYEIEKCHGDLLQLNSRYQAGISVYNQLRADIELYQETLDINQYGLYQPKYSFDISEQYKQQLEKNYSTQKQMISDGKAITCHTEWTVGGSVAEGKKMTKQYSKLMLYAFNGECDSLIAKVKWNNIGKFQERIQKAYDSLNKLGSSHNIQITYEYLNAKLDELSLTYEYELKKYEEKEEQKRIREQMREEERAQKEFERAQKEAEDDERKYQKALEKAKKELGFADQSEINSLNAKIRDLEKNLLEAHNRKERAISLAQMTKVGHIYVISNVGSFGEDVYKIGMTRRLDPQDRIKELGDASVPFQFDVHAIIYSENAPQLEYELHRRFHDRRLNRVNNRKEFFKVSLDEIELFVREHKGAEIEFTKLAEAKEYRETLSFLERLTSSGDVIEFENTYPTSII